jgi:hypothetical protein
LQKQIIDYYRALSVTEVAEIIFPHAGKFSMTEQIKIMDRILKACDSKGDNH